MTGQEKTITAEAMHWLEQGEWHGNIRELMGTIIKGYTLSDDEITLELLTRYLAKITALLQFENHKKENFKRNAMNSLPSLELSLYTAMV